MKDKKASSREISPLMRELCDLHRRRAQAAAAQGGRRENQAPRARHARRDGLGLAPAAGKEGDRLREDARRHEGGHRDRQPSIVTIGTSTRRSPTACWPTPTRPTIRTRRRSATPVAPSCRPRWRWPSASGANGTAFLRAVALGYDVGTPHEPVTATPTNSATVGHSTHSFGPTFGAAAAAGALAGVNVDQARHRALLHRAAGLRRVVLDARRGAHRESVRFRRHAGAQRRRRRGDGRRTASPRSRTCSRASAISSSPTTRRAASTARRSRSAWWKASARPSRS